MPVIILRQIIVENGAQACTNKNPYSIVRYAMQISQPIALIDDVFTLFCRTGLFCPVSRCAICCCVSLIAEYCRSIVVLVTRRYQGQGNQLAPCLTETGCVELQAGKSGLGRIKIGWFNLTILNASKR